MRILVVSAMFPPNVLGGAEISAFNLSSWLLKQGHEIGVLTAAKSPEQEKFGEIVDGMRIWSIYMPRPYPIFAQGAVQQKYLKPIWHLQDHLDPRNRHTVAKVVDEFKPDFCNVHYLTGIGHNVLSELGKRDIPVMYVMPDLALSCLRLTMFRDGKTCEQQCSPCKISAALKRSDFRSVRRIGFCAPSRANLDRNARFQALQAYPTAHILNANKYPAPSVTRAPSATVRFIYVGRLHAAKGVDMLIQAADMIQDLDYSLTIVGGGAEEEALRQKYGDRPRIAFTGHVPLQEAINRIAGSDVLCIPSIWLENSPGVVIQALGMGVPVIGSEVGGIPELVQHDENGLLVAPGDTAAWSNALKLLITDRERLNKFQRNATSRANEFDQDFIGKRYAAFMDRIVNFGAYRRSDVEAASQMTFPITRVAKFIAATMCLVPLLARPAAAETKTVVFAPRDATATTPRPIYGANIHYGLRRTLGYNSAAQGIKQLNDIGAVSFRDYLPWQSFDFRSGAPSLAYSERLMNFLPQTKLKPLLNLGGANSFVPGGVPPVSEEGLQYFDRYLDAVVELTKQYDPIYEIWNEWNMYIGTGPRAPRLQGAGDASDPRAAVHYARIARTAVDTIKRANPHATVIVGAVGDDTDWVWAQAITRHGALDHADGLSVHLYNQCERLVTNRTAKEMVVRLEKLQDILKTIRNGQQTPIYVTEFGWPTSQGNCGMPLDVSAYNFAHFVLQSATLPWLKGAWMHELKNIGPDPVDRENNFGLFTFDDQPKPAACFMREAVDLVKSAKVLELREPFPDVFVLRAISAGRQKVALWTSGPFKHANYRFDTPALHARMMCGDTIPASQPASLGARPVVYEFDQNAQIAVAVDTGELPAPGTK